ncbi:MAG: hypothetical protein ACK4GT_21915, partial [Pararhodobacter sp.]
ERDGQILVAGYTLTVWDRITAGSGQCDWNLLSGRWQAGTSIPPADEQDGADIQRNDSGRDAQRLTPAEWAARDGALPEFCQFDLGG